MKGVKSSRFEYASWAVLWLALSFPVWTSLALGQPLVVATKEGNHSFFFDQKRSSISFEASSTLHPVKGKVKHFAGKIVVPSMKDRSSGSVILDIEASSLDTNHEGRDKRVKESCLEISRFPSIQFKSIEIRNGEKDYSPGQGGRAEVIGLLDLHGVQKKILVPVDYTYTTDLLQVKGKVTIKMSDFQIPEPKFLLLRVKDEIKIEFDIQALRYSNPS
jgi:polyisoprenoid-binding protein YceI